MTSARKIQKKYFTMKKKKFGWVTFEAPVNSIVILPEEIKEIKRFGINLIEVLEHAQKEIERKKQLKIK